LSEYNYKERWWKKRGIRPYEQWSTRVSVLPMHCLLLLLGEFGEARGRWIERKQRNERSKREWESERERGGESMGVRAVAKEV
jgi:hypothetical protein